MGTVLADLLVRKLPLKFALEDLFLADFLGQKWKREDINYYGQRGDSARFLQKNSLDSPPQNYRHFTLRRQSLTRSKKTPSVFCCKRTLTGTSMPSTDLSYSEDYNKVLPSCRWDAELWQKNNTTNNWPSCVRQSDRWKPERNRRHPAAPARWWSGPTVGTRSRIALVHGTAACSPSGGQTPVAPGWTHWHTHTHLMKTPAIPAWTHWHKHTHLMNRHLPHLLEHTDTHTPNEQTPATPGWTHWPPPPPMNIHLPHLVEHSHTHTHM